MRLRSIRVRDLGPFHDFTADLSTLPEEAKLVAVTGPNGSGKSTLLELFTGGSCYRECPTRGSLASLATSRSASLEVCIENGQPWTIRHTVDSVSGKGESIAFDASGATTTSSAKVRDFDAWAASHLPRAELLYGSQVLAQGSGGFLDLKPGDRKAVVLRLLGVEKLEPMAKEARDRARSFEAQSATLLARITDEDARAVVELSEVMLNETMYTEHSLGWEVQESKAELDVARELAGSSALARQRYDEQLKAWSELLARRDSTRSQLETSQDKLVLCDVDRAANAKQRADCYDVECDVRLEDATKLAEELRVKRETAKRQTEDIRRISAEGAKVSEEGTRLALRIVNNRKILDAADEIRAVISRREVAAKKLLKLEHEEAAAGEAVDAATAALDEISNERHAGADARIRGLREGLTKARDVACCDGDYAYEIAKETLETDDSIVEATESRPIRGREAEAARLKAVEARNVATAARIDCAKLATERHPHEERLATAEARIAELQPLVDAATAEVRRLSAELAALPKPEPVQPDPDLPAIRRAAELASKRAREAGEELARVTATREQLEPQVERLRVALADLETQLASTPEPTPPEQAPNLAALEDALRATQRTHADAVAAVGKAQAAVDAAKAAQAKAEELRQELAAVRAEQEDWTRLGEDLGRDGLQAALVDSACAQLTELTNDLLHSCVGTRWTVSLETQRASADGKKQIEGFEVRVLDTEAGRDTTVETLSGGERVLVGEAISLALTTLACTRAGIERPTLVRDETGAALDPDKSRAYVAMLRRAVDQIGADRCLFVSHSLEVQELADARIRIGAEA